MVGGSFTAIRKKYLDLLTSIGIPGILDANRTIPYENELMYLASLNKIELLYAQHIRSEKEDSLIKKYDHTLKTMIEIFGGFNDSGLNYAVFKTIKPFPYTPSDIDILIAYNDLQQAKKILSHRGYNSIAKDVFCTTMYRDINIDLYLEPSVASIPYLRSTILMQEKKTTKLDQLNVTALSNEAEFIAVSCHSFYKEQMFTLNDFITLALLAEDAQLSKVIEIANDLNVLGTVMLVSGVSRAIIDELAILPKITRLFDKLNVSKIPVSRMPHKFSADIVGKMLFKKIITDRHTRKYVPRAVIANLSPTQIKKFIDHLKRATY
jgi:hypothetical protein